MSNKIKILQINSVYGKGSTGNIVKNLMCTIEEHGMVPMAAYGIGNDYTGDTILKFQNSLSVKKDIFLSRLTDKAGKFSSRGTAKLIKWIETKNPDIVHLHNIHGFYVNVPILLSYLKEKQKPVVWTMHDCWAFTGHCAHFDSIDCNKWLSHCESCAGLKKYPLAYTDRSKENFDEKRKLLEDMNNLTIVTPSKWLKEQLKKSFLKMHNVRVINNGINLEIFQPVKSNIREELGIDDDFVILGMANKCLNERNLSVIRSVADAVEGKGKIILIGSERTDIHKNIICIPKISDPNIMAKYYSMADVFINLTLEDTFPTVNIESLACGTPVVTYRTGGSPEILDEKTGYVVDKFDTNGLIEGILAIEKMSKKSYFDFCRERAEHLYNYKQKFDEYIDLYKELIN